MLETDQSLNPIYVWIFKSTQHHVWQFSRTVLTYEHYNLEGFFLLSIKAFFKKQINFGAYLFPFC